MQEKILKDSQTLDKRFVSSRAFSEVKRRIQTRNFINIVGNSGSGKTFMANHIGLMYRRKGWKLTFLEDIQGLALYDDTDLLEDVHQIFILNDPLGRDQVDILQYHSWKASENLVRSRLLNETTKILVTCRKNLVKENAICDTLLGDPEYMVDIESEECTLTKEEKEKILAQYTNISIIPDEDLEQILRCNMYFPLLCRLFGQNEEYKSLGKCFFDSPRTWVRKQIQWYRERDTLKYMSLVLLVIYNNSLELSTLEDINHEDFQQICEWCILPTTTTKTDVMENLKLLEGIFLKKVNEKYMFLHDFVSEVTACLFGEEHPKEMIRYCDISFLGRNIRISHSPTDSAKTSSVVHLEEKYKVDLIDRFLSSIQQEKILEVFVGRSLENVVLADEFNLRLQHFSDEDISRQFCMAEVETNHIEDVTENDTKLYFSKLTMLSMNNRVSALILISIFAHNKIFEYIFQRMIRLETSKTELRRQRLFPMICANGNNNIAVYAIQNLGEEIVNVFWGETQKYHSLHIAATFNNLEMITLLVERNIDIDISSSNGRTPLSLAASSGYVERETQNSVRVLLSHGANVNKQGDDGGSPLFFACQEGHISIVKVLVENGADINIPERNGVSPLFIAAQEGKTDVVSFLLSKGGVNVNGSNIDGETPLHVAALVDSELIFRLLLVHGADVNATSKDKTSPLMIACQKGNLKIVECLLEKRANINEQSSSGCTPLLLAVQMGHTDIVKSLLKSQADVNLSDYEYRSPLFVACQEGYFDIVVQLFAYEKKPEIDIITNDEDTPLIIASKRGHEKIVEYLLKHNETEFKVDVNSCDIYGETSLMLAAKLGYTKVVVHIINREADDRLKNNDDKTALYMAAERKQDIVLKQLLEFSTVTVNEPRACDGMTPLMVSSKNGHISTVEILLTYGADVNQCNRDGQNAFLLALEELHIELVFYLLYNYNPNVNKTLRDGTNPLYKASYFGDNSLVLLILSKGAEINRTTSKGASALFVAAQEGHTEVVRELLKNKADVDLSRNGNVTPLHIAARRGRNSVVELLLEHHAEVNITDRHGFTPLMTACLGGHYPIVDTLLQNGASVNPRKLDGKTSLFLVSEKGFEEIVRLLIEHGADVNICNENSESPLYVAKRKRHGRVVEILCKYTNVTHCTKF